MVSLGVEWFQYFWDGFPTYIRDSGLRWGGKPYSDKEWSTLVFNFLQGLAMDMNYHMKKEESTIKAKRFDMTWRSSDAPPKTVYIEHENQLIDVAIKEEVPKLANYRADLHVCITYVRDKDYPGDEYALQARQILEGVGYKEEFLLILGSWEMGSPSDWVCHRLAYTPKIELSKLILPAPISLIPLKEGSELEEREVEDWMINRLKVWKRIKERGGSVTRAELHDIANEIGMDNRGLGGFFVGKRRSLFWKHDRVYLSDRAVDLVKKLGKKVD